MTAGYLLFLLSGRLFGVRLVGAIEILPWRPSRRVPLSYSYVEGVLDYRGAVYPVYNLVQRLGLPKPGPAGFAVGQHQQQAPRSIILLEENRIPFGIVVDSVVKMTRLEEQVAVPDKIRGVEPRFVKGLVSDEEHEALILDFERLFHAD